MDVSPKDGMLVASSGDGSVRYWKGKNYGEAGVLPVLPTQGFSLRFSADGRLLASGGDHAVRVGPPDAASGGEYFLEAKDYRVGAIDFSPDGMLLAAACHGLVEPSGKVIVWNLPTRKVRHVLQSEDRFWMPMSLRFAPKGDVLAVGGRGSEDLSVRLWDMESGRISKKLMGHSHPVLDVAFSPDGKRFASGGGDYCVRIWNLADGLQTVRIPDFKGAVRALSFSSNGAVLVASSSDDMLQVIRSETWEVVRKIPLPTLDAKRRREFMAARGLPPSNSRPMVFCGPDLVACGLPDNTVVIVNIKE